MKPFFKVKTPEEVFELLEVFPPLGREILALEKALNRVLAEEVSSPEDLPHFARATMDGYAVRARDTFGASEAIPALLTVTGEIAMGREAVDPVQPGQSVRIATGGMLPPGADAVVMIEQTQGLDGQTIEVFKSVSPLDHVIQIGDDLRRGRTVLQAGRRLRPQDLGLLAGLGVRQVPVVQQPRVAVISTGDEIVPHRSAAAPGAGSGTSTPLPCRPWSERPAGSRSSWVCPGTILRIFGKSAGRPWSISMRS